MRENDREAAFEGKSPSRALPKTSLCVRECLTQAVRRCPRGIAVSLRRNERASLSRRRSGVPSRSFFPQKKRRHPNAQDNKAAVRGAQLRGFAKQTEKGAWKRGESLLSQTLPTPFSYRLPRQRKRPASKPIGFFVTFFDTKKVTSSFVSPFLPHFDRSHQKCYNKMLIYCHREGFHVSG